VKRVLLLSLLVYQIGIEDLKAIETFIGSKKFLMGEQVCNEDASLFGMLCQVVFHDRGPFNTYVSSIFISNINLLLV